MRRFIGVMFAAVLASGPAPSAAAFPPTPSFNFASAVFRGIFGETGDARASRAALLGQNWGESPLRGLAMDRPLPSAFGLPSGAGQATVRFAVAVAPSFGGSLARAFGARLHALGDRFVLPTQPAVRLAIPNGIAGSIATTGSYVPPGLRSSPQPDGTVAIDAPQATSDFAASPSLASTVVVPLSLHVGRLQFQGDLEGSGKAKSTPALGLRDQGYGAGADFGVRAGGRRLDVNVSSSYERLMRDDTTAYAPAPLSGSAWSIGGNALPVLLNYADLSKLAIGANVALPVTHVLTLNLNYREQRLLGGYGLPGLDNLDATDNWYGGNLTLAIPRWSSEISVSALQYHYQDNILPANTFSDTRENVNFTVKF